ncbi:signal peptidase II [Pseudothermotoga sp.]|uniref:signal peptidase II n=1 Tax=Pseudothermotoga sp. TaxID=2033661 RepID=UPI000E97B919|nr:signal peptidase II [Pseudothermotoga sp.]HBJ80677.1 signal peptidase II [Pseudothermotoga sp.]
MFWVTFVILMDQLSKMIVEKYLVQPFFAIPGILWFTYTRNTGIAFGMFSRSPWVLWITFAVTFLLAALPIFIRCSLLTRAGLQMVVGGAIGNMIDRFRFGYVVDFISVRYFPAIFNIADSFITIGGILILLSLLRGERSFADDGREKRSEPKT